MATIADVIKGLQVAAKYTKKGLDDPITPEDRAALEEAGWHESSDCDVWACFV